MSSVLLDTSFLICLSTPSRPNHITAKQYFQEFINRQIDMYLSTIVISEYECRQRIRDLGLDNFLITPFNIEDSLATARLMVNALDARFIGDDRVAVKDDTKLLAQCQVAGITHFATDDRLCVARIKRLKDEYKAPHLPFAIPIFEPFSVAWLEDGNQVPLC